MTTDAADLPSDPAALRALIAVRDAELHTCGLLIEKLKHQLAGMRRHRFGPRSEALDQLELTLEDEEIARGNSRCDPCALASRTGRSELPRRGRLALPLSRRTW